MKSMLFSVALVLGTILAFSSPVKALEVTDNFAKLHGNYDFGSSEKTTVIVELEEKSMVEAKHGGKSQTKGNLETKRNEVIEEILSHTKDTKIKREYDYLFSGFALEVPSNELLTLLTIPGIKAIYPNVLYTTTEAEMTLVDEYLPHMVNSAPYIGAREASSYGYTGDGMTVAVIDSGVDYNHPQLQHAFGDYKGYDFYDNDNDPMEGTSQHHGTHVSGIIAAKDFGVAPDAQLLVYRVLGPDGGSSEYVLAGIEQAVIDGADVMNLSIGTDFNDPDYATSIALDWAMAEGVVAVTSSGNSGPNNWTVGAPGASREAISVGSTKLPYITFDINFNTSTNVTYPTLKLMGTDSNTNVTSLNDQAYEFVYVGLGSEQDYANVDVEGKIVLIMRGGYSFTDKSLNAKKNGAVAAIIFNNGAGEITGSGTWSLPTFQLDYNDGVSMYYELLRGNNTITVSAILKNMGESISDFSSRGPAYGTWMIKPDVSAPGDVIMSTVPGGYAYLSGTSMASPHVAGAAALILQAHPGYTPEDVKASLMNTAEKLIDPSTGEYYAHNIQGAGSIRIMDAIHADTLVTPGSYSFGKFVKNTGKQVEGQSFEIKNLSNERKNYTFEVEFDGNPQGIKVLTGNNTQVKANGTNQVHFNVQVDTTILAPGYYEGVIRVSDGIEEIIVPTILFVEEPDYPRITLAGVQDNQDGSYWAYAYLPGGADYVELALFTFDAQNGAIGNYLGSPFSATEVESGYYQELWDGQVGGQSLSPGEYILYVYVEHLGKVYGHTTLFEIN